MEGKTMVARTQNTQMLLLKKLLGMVLFILGILLSASGLYYSSTPVTVVGVLALVLGVFLIARKIMQRNSDL